MEDRKYKLGEALSMKSGVKYFVQTSAKAPGQLMPTILGGLQRAIATHSLILHYLISYLDRISNFSAPYNSVPNS